MQRILHFLFKFYLQIFFKKTIMKNVQKLFIDKFLMKQKKISENTKPKKTVFGVQSLILYKHLRKLTIFLHFSLFLLIFPFLKIVSFSEKKFLKF